MTKGHAWLNAKGFRVLRFTNRQIQDHAEVVEERILGAIAELGPVPRL